MKRNTRQPVKRKRKQSAKPDPVFDALRADIIRRYPRAARSTAGHEAGHTVAIVFFGLFLSLVTIEQRGMERGRVEWNERSRHMFWTDHFHGLVIGCAGNIGRSLTISMNSIDFEGGINDYQENERVVEEMFQVEAGFYRNWENHDDQRTIAMRSTLQRAEKMARDIVLSPAGRIAVLVVAHALLEKTQLTGEEAYDLVLNVAPEFLTSAVAEP